MSIEDRTRWEEKHRRASSLSARASVLALPPAPRSGALALDLACGQGRHTAALLDAGYDVVAMDVARAALLHTREAARGAMLVQADADTWPFATESFDLVVQVDFLERRLFPVLADSLHRGGLLLIDTFLDQGRPNAEGPSNPHFLLRRAELKEAFPAFDVERYEETTGPTARASMLARKR
jgi:tellurite methyltransferase